jgi:hypothetical protein
MAVKIITQHALLNTTNQQGRLTRTLLTIKSAGKLTNLLIGFAQGL